MEKTQTTSPAWLAKLLPGVPAHRRPLAFGCIAAIPAAVLINLALPSPEQVAAELAAQNEATAQAAEQAAQAQAASQAMVEQANKENAVRSACWQYARSAVKSPRTLEGPESWINGDVNGEFVVIQPVTAENSFGVRLSATAVCSGTNGVVTSYQLDQR